MPPEEAPHKGAAHAPIPTKPVSPDPAPGEVTLQPVPDVPLPPIAHRILVPVANPNTAEGLLRLALSMLGPKGKVFAAYVTITGSEPRIEAVKKLRGLIAQFKGEGHPVELITDMATSIARGILDLAQERSADLIVLGIRGMQGDRVVLGPVVDAVARTAPCSVLVYRGLKPIYGGSGYTDVIVPVDGSHNSRLAIKIGQYFASYRDCPLTVLFVQTESAMKRDEALDLIERSLEGIPTHDRIRRLVTHADDVVDGILERAEQDNLVILGFSEDSSVDTWLFKDIPQQLLSDAPGPLLLVKQVVGETVPSQIEHRLTNLMPTLTPIEEAEVVQVAQEMATPSINFIVLVVLSCLIASLALLQNNVAVVIGAMLIAPLMSPLMGFGVGLVKGRPALMRTAAATLLRGIAVALLLAFLVGVFSPSKNPTEEMLARGQPSLPDMGVALFSGMAGAYAVARKDISSALAGVAIAAALMPPLCTVGLALAFGRMALTSGAFLLFLTNIVSISLGAGLVFLWLGLRLRADADAPLRYRRRMMVSLVVLVLLAIPLAGTLQSTIQADSQREAVRSSLEDALDGQIVDVVIEEGEPLNVVVTARMVEAPAPEALLSLQALLSDQMGEAVHLELVALQSIHALDPAEGPAAEPAVDSTATPAP